MRASGVPKEPRVRAPPRGDRWRSAYPIMILCVGAPLSLTWGQTCVRCRRRLDGARKSRTGEGRGVPRGGVLSRAAIVSMCGWFVGAVEIAAKVLTRCGLRTSHRDATCRRHAGRRARTRLSRNPLPGYALHLSSQGTLIAREESRHQTCVYQGTSGIRAGDRRA
jgi:hypothetical protein